MAKLFPFFNDDAETRWKSNNLNETVTNKMKKETRQGSIIVQKMDSFKVHNMFDVKMVHKIQFNQDDGILLPNIQCTQHSGAGEEE